MQSDPHLKSLADLLVKVAIRQLVNPTQTKGSDLQPNTETNIEIEKAGPGKETGLLCNYSRPNENEAHDHYNAT